jgi:hypothetical protein
MGSPEGHLHAEPKKVLGKRSAGEGGQGQPWLPGGRGLKAWIAAYRWRGTMNRERLEWVISGLNRYKLNASEDRFVKLVEQEFNEKKMLTEQQEERIEILYKEKSKLAPDKISSPPKQRANPGGKKFHRFLEKIR